jgi:coenzyme PQQ precursor peptide PqqA
MRPMVVMNGLDARSGGLTFYIRSFAMWTKPEYTEMRFGFEVTMYVFNR